MLWPVLFAAAAVAAPTAPTQQHAGVMADPCKALPPMPSVIADFFAKTQKAKAEGKQGPVPTADGLALYMKWQGELLKNDFAGLCRHRAANAALPAATDRRVVFFGDSITEGWSGIHPEFFAGDRINRGISGQTTLQMIGRFRADVIALRPAVVHIMAGTNDIAGNTGPTSLAAIEDNIVSMAELARAHGITVVIGSVLPARRFNWRAGLEPAPTIVALNDRLRAYAAREGLVFADYHQALDDGAGGLAADKAEDGVHPTPTGYAIMEPIANAAIEQALKARKSKPKSR